ncbi:MAG: CotH kinase family protein [Lachnospiraceae bacterium]|nr:CotH kinase family protein [Lachnospiraceae bacterium]
MNKRILSVIVISFALILPGCGMQKVRQSQAVSSAKSSAAAAEGGSKSSKSSSNAAANTKSLTERLAELKPTTPERPGPVLTPEDKPAHLEPHENVANSKLPRVDITLPDDYALTKADYTAGNISISNAGDYDLPSSAGKVRLRGNSTADAEKKSFKIKFDSKQSVYGRDPEKSWTLVSNCYDLTGIHNYVSYKLYESLVPKGTFCTLCKFVDVYVNGAYQGVYNLCDQVETGKGRVPIKGTLGETPDKCDYLIEEDFRAPTEKPNGENLEWFWLNWVNHAYKVQSPEKDDGLTKEHTAYIKSYLEDVYAAIKLKDWDAINSLMDVDSFIIGQTVAEITKNYDIFQASLFMYKKAGGKLTFGPAWDFDTTFGSCPLGEEGLPEGYATDLNPFFGGLMEVPEYRSKYVAYFNEHLNEMITQINTSIDHVNESYGENLEKDFQNWGVKSMYYGIPEMQKLTSHAAQTDFMKQWLTKRTQWLTQNYK